MLAWYVQRLGASICFQDFSWKDVRENGNLMMFHMPKVLPDFFAISNIFQILIITSQIEY